MEMGTAVVTFLFFFLALLSYRGAEGSQDVSSSSREPKFFFIHIQESSCNDVSSTETGSCQSYKSCFFNGGRMVGFCAFGMAVCCSVARTTGSSRSAVFYMKNPETISAPSDYTVTAIKSSRNIAQIRLDFVTMSLAQPNVDSVCDSSYFSTSVSSIPVICGENAGQHMYIDYPSGTDRIDLTIYASSTSDSWNVKVTQIESISVDRAPSGCLQWYRGSTGTVKSFNYKSDSTSATYQLANQNYIACIDSSGQNCITWSQTSGTAFSMSGFLTGGGPVSEGDLSAAGFDIDCQTDYVRIADGQYDDKDGAKASASRFCGGGFPTTVKSSFFPFYLGVTTNSQEGADGDDGNNGFSLDFSLTTTSTC